MDANAAILRSLLIFGISEASIIANNTRSEFENHIMDNSWNTTAESFDVENPYSFTFNRLKPLKAQRRAFNNKVMNVDSNEATFVDNNSLILQEENEKLLNKLMDQKEFAGKCLSYKKYEGLCVSRDVCLKRGGQIGNICKLDKTLHCCTFSYTCGDSSSERISYFKSPPNASAKTQGSLACDYDVTIQKDICAARIEYNNLNLARKLGGVCDVDQIYVLNSVDGPTTGQCGPLSGYVTTVAVKPSQDKPLKIALLIQNDGVYNWDIKITQLNCDDFNRFKVPRKCGVAFKDEQEAESHFTPTYTRYSFSFSTNEDEGTSTAENNVWWSYPEPIFNKYYFSGIKRHFIQETAPTLPLFKKNVAERRIVGGSETGLREFPWQVAVALDGMFFCGGALLNEEYILTAAHCIMTRDSPIEDLLLHLGDHNLMISNETEHVTRKVRKVMFHSHFHPFLLDNDIALLQLDKPVTFNANVQPICLPEQDQTYTGEKATVIGWGITAYPMGTPSPILQKIQVEVVSNFHCSRIIDENVGPGMLCAAPSALQGTCFGDSGGPLSVETNAGQTVLIGIVSYGLTGCAIVPAFPDIYTRVSEYIKWINVNAF